MRTTYLKMNFTVEEQNNTNLTEKSKVGFHFTPNIPLEVTFWVIFVVGLAGNVFLLSVNIWRRSSKQAATQFFMASLAVSDTGLMLGTAWVKATLSYDPSFKYGTLMCKITNLWSSLAADSSVVILSVIGVDR